MFRRFTILSIVAISSCVLAQVPSSVSSVETYRVRDILVRLIIHNMEINPVIEVDTINRSDYEINDVFRVSSISLDNEKLDFNQSAGVFVEEYGERDNKVFFVLDYFYLHGGGSVLVDCEVSFEKEKILPPECRVKVN